MNLKLILQVMNGLWLIEESQALYWSELAQHILVDKTMSSIPGRDPRTFKTKYFDSGIMEDAYQDIYRVDKNGVMKKGGEVQVMNVSGPLMQDDYCGSPGMNTMQQVIRAANADSSIQSIVLVIDSPGGTVSGTHNLAREIKASKKPVVAFVNKIMASAAYWVGSSAREIFADDETAGYNTIIGSIGTKAMIVDRSGELKAKGIRLITVNADDSGRKGKYLDDVLAGDHTRLKSDLNQINSIFLAAVKENRAGRLKTEKENVLDGEIYNAREALKYGLIDKLGSFEDAVKRSLQLTGSAVATTTASNLQTHYAAPAATNPKKVTMQTKQTPAPAAVAKETKVEIPGHNKMLAKYGLEACQADPKKDAENTAAAMNMPFQKELLKAL